MPLPSIPATTRQGSSRNSAKRGQPLTLDRKNNLAPPPEWVNKGAQGTRGGGQVKQISIFVLGFATAFASASALAQDLTAGKTPAQLFRSDCAECHRSPSGLAKTRDVRALADFLREHYTTKSETAGALAAYVSSLAAGGAAARNRGNGTAAPATGGYPRRNRGEADATANGGDAASQAVPAEDPAGRRRRTTSLSGDREKRRVDSDGEAPRPPAGIMTTRASPKSNGRPRSREPRHAIDPISRLRSYLPSGGGAENAIEETGKTRAPKAHKRRNRANAELQAPDARAKTKTDADAPPSATIGPTAPGAPQQSNASLTSAPTVPPAVTSP